MLEDDRIADPLASRSDVLAADDGDGGGRLDAEPDQTLILRDLGDLELESALAIDDGAPVSRQPRENSGRVLGRIAMSARMRGCAHAVVEDSLGRWRCQVDHATVEEPLRKRSIDGRKFASQRLDPRGVLVQYKDARLSELAGSGQRHAIFLIVGARDLRATRLIWRKISWL